MAKDHAGRISTTCWGRHHKQCSGRNCACVCHGGSAQPENWLALVIREADLDPQLVEHVNVCPEKFCENFRKLLFYAEKEARGRTTRTLRELHTGFEAVQDV